MEFNAFRKMVLKKALDEGFSECELYYSEGESLSVGVYEGEVEKYSLEKSKGLSFRGKINGKMGYSFTEILDFEAINMLIKNAKESAVNIDSEDEEFIYSGDNDYNKVDTYSDKIENLDPKKVIDLAIDMEREAKAYSDKVVNIHSCKIVYKMSKQSIYNSKGVKLNKKSNKLMAYVTPIVKENESKQDDTGYVIASDIKDIVPKDIAKEGVQKALDKLNATSINSGEYKVIVNNEAMASLLQTFSSIFSAHAAQKGMSLLKGREGQLVASDIVTIVDNPLLPNGLASAPFDDEGVKTYKKDIVSNGKLNTLLYNLKTANNAKTKSTGNGFKSSYNSPIGVDCSNLYIEKGDKSLEDLSKEIVEGVMITELAGLHSGANPISGDFSLAAKGFYIQDGKKSYPVEQITVAGNYFELLKNIEAIGNDLVFPLSSVGSPSVIVSKLSIAGK